VQRRIPLLAALSQDVALLLAFGVIWLAVVATISVSSPCSGKAASVGGLFRFECHLLALIATPRSSAC
jgi:hypothetical protein